MDGRGVDDVPEELEVLRLEAPELRGQARFRQLLRAIVEHPGAGDVDVLAGHFDVTGKYLGSRI